MNFHGGTNEPDIVAAETGRVFVAKTPEQFNHDADGNLLQDGRFNYSWDGENRLIGVETRTGALPGNVPRIKVEMKYDYLGRRVGKQVWEMRGQWSLLSSQAMIYDGWNLIREETTASGTGKIVDEYIWGLDLSGSLQGAGGVGGLLCRQRSEERYYDGQGKLIICHHPPRNPEQPKTIRINENIWPLHEAHGDTLGACEGPNVTNSSFFYTYDGNGNVSELLTTGSWLLTPVVAHYEYSPFGETIVATGPEAQDNTFRFSTKYWDDESGLYYYGYRYYSPSLGRWFSSDPLMDPAAPGTLMIRGILVYYADQMVNVISATLLSVNLSDKQKDELLVYLLAAAWIRDSAITGNPELLTILAGNHLYQFCANNPVNFIDPYGLWQAGMFFRGLGGAVVSGVGAVVGAAAATTGVGSVPGGALALYSSYNFGANVGNMVNSFRDVQAAPTGPIAGATVLATDSRTARNIAEAADLAIPFALSIGTSPVAWSRLPTAPVGPAGTLAGTLQRVPGDPAVIYPWIRGFQIGDAGLTAYDAWRWTWDDDPNNPCK